MTVDADGVCLGKQGGHMVKQKLLSKHQEYSKLMVL